MKIGFEQIGAVAASFAAEGLEAGQVCRITDNGKVGTCADGEVFAGLVEGVRNGWASVQVAGFCQVNYTGTKPGVGYVNLAADGNGGVKTVSSGGRQMLVVSVDEAAGIAVIKL